MPRMLVLTEVSNRQIRFVVVRGLAGPDIATRSVAVDSKRATATAMPRIACGLAECSISKEGWTMKHVFLTVGMALLFGIVGAAQAAGDAKAGKAKAGTCAGCHGANGEGVAPMPLRSRPMASEAINPGTSAMKNTPEPRSKTRVCHARIPCPAMSMSAMK